MYVAYTFNLTKLVNKCHTINYYYLALCNKSSFTDFKFGDSFNSFIISRHCIPVFDCTVNEGNMILSTVIW